MKYDSRFSSRAQGGTEYLVILAAVLVIGIVAVGLMTYFVGSSGGISESESQAYWSSAAKPLQITQASAGGSTYRLVVKNTRTDFVTLGSVIMDNSTSTPVDVSIPPGGTITISVSAPSNCSAAGSYLTSNVKFTYSTGMLRDQVQVGEKPIVTSCATASTVCSVESCDNGETCCAGFICLDGKFCKPSPPCATRGESCDRRGCCPGLGCQKTDPPTCSGCDEVSCSDNTQCCSGYYCAPNNGMCVKGGSSCSKVGQSCEKKACCDGGYCEKDYLCRSCSAKACVGDFECCSGYFCNNGKCVQNAKPLEISTTSLPAGREGTPYSATLAASGGTPPYSSWGITRGAMPEGLTLESKTGVLSGTPTRSGIYDIGFIVHDFNGAIAEKMLAMAVNPADPGALPLKINSKGIPNGYVGMKYTATFAATGGRAPYYWNMPYDVPSGLSLDPNTGVLSGFPDTPGDYKIQVTVFDSSPKPQFATATFSMSVYSADPLSITTSVLPTAYEETPYSASIVASGGTKPYSWQWEGGNLPNGLDFGSGVVSGVPKEGTRGIYSIILRVCDNNGCADKNKEIFLAVNPASPTYPLSIITSSLPDGTVGEDYEAQLTAGGGNPPYAWGVYSGSLPVGFSIDSERGIIYAKGTDIVAGLSNFVIIVSDREVNTVLKQFSIRVSENSGGGASACSPSCSGESNICCGDDHHYPGCGVCTNDLAKCEFECNQQPVEQQN